MARYDAFPACGDILDPQGAPTTNPAAPLGLAVAESATVNNKYDAITQYSNFADGGFAEMYFRMAPGDENDPSGGAVAKKMYRPSGLEIATSVYTSRIPGSRLLD